jgi:tetratricopeptide (TPR) repeat protein
VRPSITSVLFCLLLSVRLYAASDNDERKSLESKAKALIEQGKALEKQDRLLDARDTYAEAQGIIETREGAKATYEVNQEIYKRVKKLMGEAKRTYSAGNYSEALESLSKAFAVQPENPSVSYNLALCYVKLKDRPKAVESLDSTIHSVSDPKEKEKLTELRDSLLSDESAVSLNQVDKEKVKELNALSISLENSSWRDTFTSSEEPPITGADPADPSSVPTANLVDAKPNDPSAAGKSRVFGGKSREPPNGSLS